MDLLKRYPIVSDQINARELAVILRESHKVLNNRVQGDVVELGCYVGTTSLFLQRQCLETTPSRALHVYDSFAGLPPKTNKDLSPAGEQFVAGELTAAKSQLIRNFKQAHLPLPIIHKGWFGDLSINSLQHVLSAEGQRQATANMSPQAVDAFHSFVHSMQGILSSSITQVFLLSAAVMAVAFIISFFLKELPLRETPTDDIPSHV